MKKYICKDCKKELNSSAKYNKAKRCHSCTAKKLYKEKKHPFIKLKGKHSWNYKGIDKKCKCIDCKGKISKTTYYRGKRCKSCESKRRIKMGITGKKGQNMGDKNPNWRGGKSFEPYSIEWTNELKEQIRKRDNYTCQKCDITEKEHLTIYHRKLVVHHIDYNKKNCNEDNLITLCNQCNTRANFNRDYWINLFKNKIFSLLKENK